MFGYVMADAATLSTQAQARYKAAYCGLCHSLSGKISLGRLLLSFDMAYLTLLLDCAYESEISASRLKCLVHPIKPRECDISKNTSYAADMTIILAYHKAVDDIIDDNKLTARFSKKHLENAYRAACERHGAKADSIEASLMALEAIERRNRPGADTDEASKCFGRLLGEVFAEGEFAQRLRPFGEALGRFIYIMDAWEDAGADRKYSRYNPLILNDTFEQDTYALLKALMAACIREFEKLPLSCEGAGKTELEILRNVLYRGIWTRYDIKRAAKQKKPEKRKA